MVKNSGNKTNQTDTRIMTVCGEITPESLGFTTMHEHPLGTMSPYAQAVADLRPDDPFGLLDCREENYAWLRANHALFSDECQLTGEYDHLRRELEDFKRVGGKAVVDASADGLRQQGDVLALRTLSQETNIHIITCAGLYVLETRKLEMQTAGKDKQKLYLANYLEKGIDGTGIFPGFLKCAVLSPDGKLREEEITTLRACAELSVETGLSVQLHPLVSQSQVVELTQIALDECGMDPDKLVILHQDSQLRTAEQAEAYVDGRADTLSVDLSNIRRLLQMGVNVSFDTLTLITDMLLSDMDKMKALIQLLREGWGDHIVLGHDIINKPRGASCGGYGYKGFALVYLPVLRRFGLESEIRKLTIDNPARILSYHKA